MWARWNRLSLTKRILVGLAVGLAVGVFFGERAQHLQGLANAFIGLLQMTVLPYLFVALVLGLGRLSPSRALLLARYGLVTLVGFWTITLAVVSLMPLTFPAYKTASFFSTAVLEPPKTLSFVELYVPSNPFYALANNLVPAVTLFSSALGIALIGVSDKERILGPLEALMKAISRITQFVVELTPFGVVPIAAVAAGTMSGHDFARLQVYFIAFIAAALLIGFVLLPALVAAVTPFRYREVLGVSHDAVLTAFLTSNVFVVLPMIADRCERLAVQHGLDADAARSVPDVVIPIAFNFPTAGKLLTLLFVPFAAWLAGSPLEVEQYPMLMLSGLFSYFAKAQLALPFLMDLMELPQDLFQLYVPTALLNGKFDSAVSVMSLFGFAMITAAAMGGRLTRTTGSLARFVMLGCVSTVAALAITRVGLQAAVDTRYTRAEALQAMQLPRSPPPTRIYEQAPEADQFTSMAPSLERVRARGAIRVGYRKGRLPFTFFNAEGDLVGFDVEMSSQLARDLGVNIEWVPVSASHLDDQLGAGEVDLVPNAPYTHYWLGRLRLSQPYIEGTIGLLVRDERRKEFATAAAIARHAHLRVGIPGDAELDYVPMFFGDVPYEIVNIESWDGVFSGEIDQLDAVLGVAEIGMAWTLIHPEFTVVIPRDIIVRRPLAYAMAPGAADLAQFVDEWIVLQKARGNVTRAYDYWILGHGAEPHRHRWSIASDVLGWTD